MGFFVFFCVLALILFGIFLATAYISYIVRHNNHSSCRFYRRKSVSTLAVLGSGGHTTEMIELLKHMSDSYTPRTYIIAETDKMSEHKILDFENQRTGKFDVVFLPRSREVGQSYISSVFTTLNAFYFSLGIVYKYNPELLLVNGPGTCIPVVFAAALLDIMRLRDTVIIYEESICRVQKLSLSGAILYFSGLADAVVVQWKELKTNYGRTIFIGDLPLSGE